MVRFKVEHVFITRKCSARCWHCRIWRTHRVELPPDVWARIINAHYDSLSEFIIIIGGEPLEYWRPFEGLLELVKRIRRVEYAVLSNSMALTWDRAKKLVEAGLKNWSVSIDYPEEYALMMAYRDPRIGAGWRAINMFKRLGLPDIHATVTIYPENIHYLPKIVDELMSKEVWIAITFAMWAKAPWYDSFPDFRVTWDEKGLGILRKVIDKLKGYRYFHGDPAMYEGENLRDMINATFRCEKLLVPTVDEDGYMRMCRDIPGEKVRKWWAMDVLKDIEGFMRDWQEDYKKYCLGCNWDCTWDAKHAFSKFKHIPYTLGR